MNVHREGMIKKCLASFLSDSIRNPNVRMVEEQGSPRAMVLARDCSKARLMAG